MIDLSQIMTIQLKLEDWFLNVKYSEGASPLLRSTEGEFTQYHFWGIAQPLVHLRFVLIFNATKSTRTMKYTIELQDLQEIIKIPSTINNGEKIIVLSDDHFTINGKKTETINLQKTDTSITFEVTAETNHLWASSYDDLSGNQIISGYEPSGSVNEIVLSLASDLTVGEQESFTLHCFFLLPGEAGNNEVYHCSIDPNLKVDQGGGGF